MSEIRKQNLREGVSSLRVRQQREKNQMEARSAAKRADRERRLSAPEREDERLTAPSNNLDLDALFNKPIPDPTREARLERKRANVAARALEKQEERMDSLHTLYMNARDFIVTPEQLDKAVDDVSELTWEIEKWAFVLRRNFTKAHIGTPKRWTFEVGA